MANNIIYLDISEEMLFEQLNESDLDNGKDWGQFERNQNSNFLFHGNISKKVQRQHQSHYELVMMRTPKTI